MTVEKLMHLLQRQEPGRRVFVAYGCEGESVTQELEEEQMSLCDQEIWPLVDQPDGKVNFHRVIVPSITFEL